MKWSLKCLTFKMNLYLKKSQMMRKPNYSTVPPPAPPEDTFQEPEWMPGTMHSTEPCIHCFFLYIRMLFWLLFGISKLPASLLLHFGAVVK